jgi:adenine-specific DNA-methyltransferase
VRDALRVAGADRKDAVILDFFAGSGTTLNAVALLNANDDGYRKCILVTNNEVSDEEARALRAEGVEPGGLEWERRGICQAITFPRCKYVIEGSRGNGAKLPGDYLTGRTEEQEIRRDIRSMDFVSPESVTTSKGRESLAGAIGFSRSKVNGDSPFFLAQDESVAALLDPSALEAFLEQGEDWADGIETVYLPFRSGKAFNQARDRILEAWPSLTKVVEIKRPIKEGFAANLDYFRLDFLDRSQAEIGGNLSFSLACHMPRGCSCVRTKSTPTAPLEFDDRLIWWNSRLERALALPSCQSRHAIAAVSAFADPPRLRS